MKLRDAIRSIVREVVGEDLRQLVREVLMEELLEPVPPAEGALSAASPNPRSDAARKAAATRKANLASGKLPKAAREMGLAVGQTWKGKSYNRKVADRVIEIQSVDSTGVIPKIVSASTKRTASKHISFEHLRSTYDLQSGPGR